MRWPGLVTLGFGTLLAGCGGGGTPPSQPVSTLSITQQPADAVVPLGSAQTFAVVADGCAPACTYVWSRNGSPIAGATSAQFTTGQVSLGDDGDQFSVVVQSGSRSLQSRTARISIGARSPKDGDIRFQMVGASASRNGYTSVGIPAFGTFGSEGTVHSFGVPLNISPCHSAYHTFSGCLIVPAEYVGPPNTQDTNTWTAQFDRMSDGWNEIQGLKSNMVVNGLEINPQYDILGYSRLESNQSTGFLVTTRVVALDKLADSVAADGRMGRVTTAVSFDIGGVRTFSYSWDQDAGAQYETKVAISTPDQALQLGAAMAAQGYIITCMGGPWFQGIILVGTKVAGDTLPRQTLLVLPKTSSPDYLSQGYVQVGRIDDASYTPTLLVER